MPSSPAATPTRLIDDPSQLPADFLRGSAPMALPTRLLMCPPDDFDVVDVKNPHMRGNVGRVDRSAARRQWDELRAAFQRCGARVDEITPTRGCEDMVFCANQTFPGVTPDGRRVCLLSNMHHESRRREVPAFADWFRAAGYEVLPRGDAIGFEGSGDAIWHPGRRLIWGGYGHRTESTAYDRVASLFGAPIIRLKLLSDRFYHLDTCLCAIDERTALINPRAFEPHGVALIRSIFERVIDCPTDEADTGMACNATAIAGRAVVIQRGNPHTVAALRELGYAVEEVDTGEFLKSGGSVFCMKMYVF